MNSSERNKTENEFLPKETVKYIHSSSSDTIKDLIGKKKVSRKYKKNKIAYKFVLLVDEFEFHT